MRISTAGPLGLDPAAFDATAEQMYTVADLSPSTVREPRAVSSFLKLFVARVATTPTPGAPVTFGTNVTVIRRLPGGDTNCARTEVLFTGLSTSAAGAVGGATSVMLRQNSGLGYVPVRLLTRTAAMQRWRRRVKAQAGGGARGLCGPVRSVYGSKVPASCTPSAPKIVGWAAAAVPVVECPWTTRGLLELDTAKGSFYEALNPHPRREVSKWTLRAHWRRD